jgi:peroxiredoxin
MAQSSLLRVAPAFELPTPLGEVRTLESLLEKGRLLLVFHRGTW